MDRAAIDSRASVLIVDDSAYARGRLRTHLERWGYAQVGEASDGTEALAWFARHRPALVLMDQVMRGPAGIETARKMIGIDPAVTVVMLTVVTDPEVHAEAIRAGVRRVLPKADWGALGAALAELVHV
jgi:DNA-binding NarL/FixJ family response regulator